MTKDEVSEKKVEPIVLVVDHDDPLMMAMADCIQVMSIELTKISQEYYHDTKGKEAFHDPANCLPCRAKNAVDIGWSGVQKVISDRVKKRDDDEGKGEGIIIQP
ncbi:MAG: hypothetical protein AB7H97_06345 [Pseudobdellovibrionaceae bacterium]